MTITPQVLKRMKAEGTPFAGLVLYDATFARLAESAGVEVVVVGDTVGMAIQGHDTTVVTDMEAMVYHTRAVAQGHGHGLLVGDLPFMSYATPDQAIHNASGLMQAGAHMVKLEGSGGWVADTVAFLVRRGIPVCGHIGWTPQTCHQLGGHRIQGGAPEEAIRLLEEARALQDAGADLMVVGCVPKALGRQLSESLDIPVMGAGAGLHCDGQVLLVYDALGLSPSIPSWARNYLEAGPQGALAALTRFVHEVKASLFPRDEHSYGLEAEA